MSKTGRHDKKPRKQTIMVGSSERLKGFDYNHEKRELMGRTLDDRLVKPDYIHSQTHYERDSGKEKVIFRIHDKVIPNQAALLKYLSSSFDLILAVDTNTKVIEGETISVTGTVHCVIQSMPEPDSYCANFLSHGAILFRNCPNELHPEKYGWMATIKANHRPQNKLKRFAVVTDHDLDNHNAYNSKQRSIFGNFYLPDNFTLIYGSDKPKENLLNVVVKECDKISKETLNAIEQNKFVQFGNIHISINQIPVPSL